MNPLALAGPAVEPIPLARMKTWLRLDGTEEDELVSALVSAARATIERRCDIALIEQSWQYALAAWPEDRAIRLPFHPVMRIAELRVLTEGGTVIVPPESYRLEARGGVFRLLLSGMLPAPRADAPRIEIDAVCGFGSDPADVPGPLLQAIRLLVAHWFEHRGDEPRSGGVPPPADLDGLVAPFRRPRLA